MPKPSSSPLRGRLKRLAILAIAPLLVAPVGANTSQPTQLAAAEGPGFPLPPACEDGLSYDDGTVETGYGWVPSVIDGIYVQLFDPADFISSHLDRVCVCWLRTRQDDTIDFELVFYEDVGGEPGAAPYASVAAQAQGVPVGVTGAWYEVPAGDIELRPGPAYIGVRWDASVDQFFFLCADSTPSTPFHNVFFIDDRAEEWGNAADTIDPVFTNHRAVMVRPVVTAPFAIEIPALAPAPLAGLALALGYLALARLRRQRANRAGPQEPEP